MKTFFICVLIGAVIAATVIVAVEVLWKALEKYMGNDKRFKKAKEMAERIVYGEDEEDYDDSNNK